MVDIVSIGVHSVIDQKYRRKVQLGLSGLFLAVSAATAVWFIFPASQSVLTPFLLPAIFLLFTLSIGYYTFLFDYDKKSVVNNVLGITEPAESVKRVHCQEKIQSLLGEVRSITRDKFCDMLVDLCFEDRKEAHKLALYVKEIEGIISTITSEDLLSYFDQFFTMIEISDNKSRCELIKFARTCKSISATVPSSVQESVAMQAKLYNEDYLHELVPKSAEIAGDGALISLIPSKINSLLLQVSEVNNDIRLIT